MGFAVRWLLWLLWARWGWAGGLDFAIDDSNDV
jgi:hypothetical protein